MRLLRCLLLALVLAGPAQAAPQSYVLDREQTLVEFIWQLGPDVVTGTMPVRDAVLMLDFSGDASSVSVTLDVAGARAGFPFATGAMIGPKVLDAAQFPVIRFESTNVTRDGFRAEIAGLVTVRGVSRPVVLRAELFRQQGVDPGAMEHLAIALEGAVSRSAFGAVGWPDMVGDTVRFRIRAYIDKAS